MHYNIAHRYLRCEVQNPQFATRYDVLLEAYLMACGKNMLVHVTSNSYNSLHGYMFTKGNFLDQVTTLTDFEAISKEVAS